MGANTKSQNAKSHDKHNFFYRKIFCGHCGRALERRKSRDGHNYFCSTRSMKSGLNCMRGTISTSAISETVLAVIRLQAQLADNIKAFNTTAVKSSSMTITELRGESQNLQRLIEKSNSTKLALWEKQHAGSISKEAYQCENEKLSKQVTAYTEKIADLETQIHRLEMESGQENAFVERYSKQVCISELSLEIVNEFIQAIHVYTPDRVEITLNYIDEFERLQTQTGN